MSNNEEVDDLIVAAQDALFDGNLADVITNCQNALKIAPKENEAYELICFAYSQTACLASDYLKILEVTADWQKNCGERAKQLVSIINASYHADLPDSAIQAAKKLNSISKSDYVMDKALAAALISDLGRPVEGLEVANTCVVGDDFDDTSYLVRLQTLLAWVGVSTPEQKDIGVQALEDLLAESQPDIPGVGLIYALLVINALNSGKYPKALEILDQATKKGLENDENVQGAFALYFLAVDGSISEQMIKMAKVASSSGNAILKKRVNQKILYPK